MVFSCSSALPCPTVDPQIQSLTHSLLSDLPHHQVLPRSSGLSANPVITPGSWVCYCAQLPALRELLHLRAWLRPPQLSRDALPFPFHHQHSSTRTAHDSQGAPALWEQELALRHLEPPHTKQKDTESVSRTRNHRVFNV